VCMVICGRSFMSVIVSMKSFESIEIFAQGLLSPWQLWKLF
jgi:tryptophan-rich sensory protein